jgi:hypothetical protein
MSTALGAREAIVSRKEGQTIDESSSERTDPQCFGV